MTHQGQRVTKLAIQLALSPNLPEKACWIAILSHYWVSHTTAREFSMVLDGNGFDLRSKYASSSKPWPFLAWRSWSAPSPFVSGTFHRSQKKIRQFWLCDQAWLLNYWRSPRVRTRKAGPIYKRHAHIQGRASSKCTAGAWMLWEACRLASLAD